MGLDVSHGAFIGAYSAFNRFRKAVATAIGGSWPPHADPELNPERWYWGDDYSPETHPGVYALLSHSDCEGEISPENCARLADELEAMLPIIDKLGDGSGHIHRDGGYGAVARRFIDGCREAAAADEPLEFF